MIDLETLDTKSSAVILSIGAVAFDEENFLGEFYTVVNTESCVSAGLTISESTQNFWEEQAKNNIEAAKILDMSELEITPTISSALLLLSNFCNQYPDVKVWGNGASFDNAILAYAYTSMSMDIPWMFFNDRCYRTINSIYKDVSKSGFIGVKHNALDDAKNQAVHLLAINKQHPEILRGVGESF